VRAERGRWSRFLSGFITPNREIRSLTVASPVTTNHVAKGSVFVNLINTDNLNNSPGCRFAAAMSKKDQESEDHKMAQKLQVTLALTANPSLISR